jgi:hypothetical protein
VETWIAFKALAASWVGLDRDALHLAGSILAILFVALITRRPLSSTRPWLLLFALVVVDEIASAALDGTLGRETFDASWRDVVLVMAIPTILLVLTRFVPALMAEENRSLRVLLPLPAERGRKPEIVDAEYEEVQPKARRKTPTPAPAAGAKPAAASRKVPLTPAGP